MARVACIGTGLVGSAWGLIFAKGGHDVALYDSADEPAQAGARASIRKTLALLAEAGALTEAPETIESRIGFAATLAEAVAGATHVQESVKEDVEVKRAVFAEIVRHAPADCILASSTSAISGSRFLGAGGERALVAHPVNPPSLIPLVELCGTPATGAATIERTRAFMTALGMTPVVLNKEIDGFLLNRLQYTLVAEALHLVAEGYCSAADVDRVMTDGLALRWATIGPFEVAHLNSPKGFRGFVDHLGPMMRRIGEDARPAYPWPDALATRIHEELAQTVPVETLAARQAWRDSNILATRLMQAAARERACAHEIHPATGESA